jgi:hypothetical protein
MIDIVIERDFTGPSLLDLEPILDTITAPSIVVRWHNSKAEQHLIRRHRDRNFVLMINDIPAMEAVVNALNLPIKLTPEYLEQVKMSLVSRKNYNWRSSSIEARKSIITKLASEALRKGDKPKLSKVVTRCLLDGVSAMDADVLLRLAAMKRT